MAKLTAAEKRSIVFGTRRDAEATILKVRDEFRRNGPLRPVVTKKTIAGVDYVYVGTRFRLHALDNCAYYKLQDMASSLRGVVGTLPQMYHYIHSAYMEFGTNSVLEYSVPRLRRIISDKMASPKTLHALNAKVSGSIVRNAVRDSCRISDNINKAQGKPKRALRHAG